VILKFFTHPLTDELLGMARVLVNIPWYHGSVVVIVAATLTESFH
jgi:hypothetical protein